MDSNYPKDWNLFAFYGIFKDERVRASQLGPYPRGDAKWDYHVVKEDVQIDNWVKHHDYGAASIEPQEGGKLFVDVVALSPRAEQHVDFVEGVAMDGTPSVGLVSCSAIRGWASMSQRLIVTCIK